MSVAAAETVPLAELEPALPLPDGIGRRGLVLSATLHLILGVVLIFGLPTLFHPPAPEEMPIAVQLVTMGPETRATHPNPNTPEPHASLEPPLPGPPAEKPAPNPTPPKPAPPPAAAEAPPAPPAPTPPEAKPAPPAPAVPKTEAPKQAELPPPPLPEPKPTPPPPPPKPAVAAAPPKPPPERPQQVARNEANAEAKKYNPGQFDALLRNLAAEDTPPSPDAPPQTKYVASGRASAQPRAPLGSQLSASEMDMVREQISRCWNVPAGARDAKGSGRDDQGRGAARRQRAAGDHRRSGAGRRRSVLPSGGGKCPPGILQPTVPSAASAADKYELWKDMTVAFSPKDLL